MVCAVAMEGLRAIEVVRGGEETAQCRFQHWIRLGMMVFSRTATCWTNDNVRPRTAGKKLRNRVNSTFRRRRKSNAIRRVPSVAGSPRYRSITPGRPETSGQGLRKKPTDAACGDQSLLSVMGRTRYTEQEPQQTEAHEALRMRWRLPAACLTTFLARKHRMLRPWHPKHLYVRRPGKLLRRFGQSFKPGSGLLRRRLLQSALKGVTVFLKNPTAFQGCRNF